MPCVILRPDPKALFNHFKSMFESNVLGGGKVYGESTEWYVVSNDVAMAESFYAISDQLWKESNPETACCENLYKMAAQHGVYPRPATQAEGYAKVQGTPGAVVPQYFEISTDLGIFVSVGTVPMTIPSSGFVIIQVRALVPGPEMNAPGNVLTGTMTTPVNGIEPLVEICGGMFCNGQDAEDCEAFRKRYLDRLAYQPKATMAWIQAKLMEWPCATHVCIREGSCCRCTPECTDCGCKNCGNRLEFYVLFRDSFPCGIPPANLVEDITTWMFGDPQGFGEGEAPIGICGQVFAAKALMVDVHVDIAACPTSSQKSIISDQIVALFNRICPSKDLCAKQLELIVASVIGADVNAAVRFSIPGYEDSKPPYPRNLAYLDGCCIYPECDVLPCLNTITFTQPNPGKPC